MSSTVLSYIAIYFSAMLQENQPWAPAYMIDRLKEVEIKCSMWILRHATTKVHAVRS